MDKTIVKAVKFLSKYTEKEYNKADLEFRRFFSGMDTQAVRSSVRMELLIQNGFKPKSKLLQSAMTFTSLTYYDVKDAAYLLSECNLWKK